MADSGRISGPVSVLLRSVLKIIGTYELSLRRFVHHALLEVLEIFLGGYIKTQASTVVDLFDFKLGRWPRSTQNRHGLDYIVPLELPFQEHRGRHRVSREETGATVPAGFGGDG